MAFPRNSLRAFLSHAKTTLTTALNKNEKITLVIGNESADLDSLTSSILYAYLRSLSPPRGSFTPLCIPLLNIPTADISLRPEFKALFRHANIEISHISTLDDLPSLSKITESLPPSNTRWILVDHNKLQGRLGEIYSDQVHGAIDHHEEENAVPQDTDPDLRVIEKCGSCTSLVVRTMRSAWDASTSSALSSGAAHGQGDSLVDDVSVIRTWDAQVAKLALASILVDTTNLTAEWKVENVDREAVNYLEAKIGVASQNAGKWDRAQFYTEIATAEKDIENLPFDDILRKDYKRWTEHGQTLGISSVVRPLDFLVEKATKDTPPHDKETHFVTAIGDFMTARSLSIFAIMTTSTSANGDFQRELLLQATSPGSAAANTFAKSASSELGLEDRSIAALSHRPGAMQPSSEGPWRKIWLQKDVSKSRKQVAPLLRKAIRAEGI